MRQLLVTCRTTNVALQVAVFFNFLCGVRREALLTRWVSVHAYITTITRNTEIFMRLQNWYQKSKNNVYFLQCA